MKIETNNFLTVPQAMKEIGCSRRAMYRILHRAASEGFDGTQEVLGRVFIKRSALPTLKNYYYPFGSEQRSELAKECGRKGGTQKGINARAAKRGQPSSA